MCLLYASLMRCIFYFRVGGLNGYNWLSAERNIIDSAERNIIDSDFLLAFNISNAVRRVTNYRIKIDTVNCISIVAMHDGYMWRKYLS